MTPPTKDAIDRGKILVVDDRPHNLLAMETALKDVGAEIFTAQSGNEALTLMLHHHFALVLLDVQMPEMDGFEVAALMRGNEDTKHIPIIFVTAISKDDEYVFRGYKTGAVDYLFKPINQDILCAKVQVFLDMHRQRRQLESANARALAANRAKSEYLANMSHEIRTPMTAILGFTENLLQEEDSGRADPERLESLQTVLRNGRHLLRLVNDILDLSKIEAGKVESESVRFSPFGLAREVVSLMQVRADDAKIALELRFQGRMPETMCGDPMRLRQILINLVGNAIKFTHTGRVRLNVASARGERRQPTVRFEVNDTGIGMTDRQIDGLFEAFSQADDSTTRKYGGSGLGLAISKRLTEIIGGTISVTSKPGKGSTFHLEVPTGPLQRVAIVDAAEFARRFAAVPQQPDRAFAPSERLDCRILLAEDGPDNQRLIAFILKQAGADVTVAENGQIACEKFRSRRRSDRPFDLVLMDMQMPVMDGYTATGQLRAQGATCPVIALTAHAMTGDRKKCIDAGCDDYVTKPIKRSQLLALVAEYARRAGHSKETSTS